MSVTAPDCVKVLALSALLANSNAKASARAVVSTVSAFSTPDAVPFRGLILIPLVSPKLIFYPL